MSYGEHLPQIFPIHVLLSPVALKHTLDLLTGPRRDVPAGSSFAVISGISSGGSLTLWLSWVSAVFLETSPRTPPVVRSRLAPQLEAVRAELKERRLRA